MRDYLNPNLNPIAIRLVVETTTLLKSVKFPLKNCKELPNFDGYSIPILKQRISHDKIDQPKWIQDSDVAQFLAPFALCEQLKYINQWSTVYAPEFGMDYTGILNNMRSLAKIGNFDENEIDDILQRN